MSCGTYGYPSSDNSIRLYTPDECSALGGNFSANGECLKKEGGSFSWDCRSLNSSVSPFANSMMGSSSSSMTIPTYVWIGGALVAAYFLMK
jgi:hypothetical protein